MYGTLSLFGGIVFYKGIDSLVHKLEGEPIGDHGIDIDMYDLDGPSSVARNLGEADAVGKKGTRPVDHAPPSSSNVAPSDLTTLQQTQLESSSASATPPSVGADISKAKESASGSTEGGMERTEAGVDVDGGAAVADGDNEKLVRMGLMTAVAIGIHNFPEGLATFVAALSDPSVGAALAVAIAIHNVPEGLCVAIPVYYATGNRWKAFGWALLSGISEPIGAALGWLVLKDIMSELVYGILFGVVAGMMVNITIHELIPTAVRYDPGDKVTTNSIIVGMAIMALSLTLFLY